MPLLSTDSALNARYVIPRNSPAEDSAYARQLSTLITAGPEMDKWLENVFNHALGEPVDDLGGNNLTGRLKGGGDKQTQVGLNQKQLRLPESLTILQCKLAD